MSPKEWCVANRQWRRQDNIKHAAYQHSIAPTPEAQRFWIAVHELLK